jgi:shikimate dehydrogenase
VITGTTRLAGVIGHPVAHSLSPALHNAGFASLRLDWVYVAFDVPEGATAAALAAMRTFGLGGLSVTMPHKEAVAAAVDVLDPAAAALRSVNTVVRLADGRLAGHSTDGDGFVAALVAAGQPIDGGAFCVLGAGGAARSIVEALARNRAGSVVVVNRSAARAADAAALAGDVGRVGQPADVTAADVVVNATSVGMGSRELPVPLQRLRCGQVVVDIVYHPRRTALLEAADAIGATVVDGLGMLVHQAALQQALWTGRTPDIAAMAAAAEHELGRRESAAR